MTHVPHTDVKLEESSRQIHFEDLAVGDRSPTIEIEDVKVTDFVRYAGAAGDFNPLHHDREFTTDAGYDDVFAMGMFNAGLLTNVVTEWFDLSTITTYRTQFDTIVWPGDDLVGYATVAELESKTATVTCDLVMENQDGEQVISGTVQAELPHSED